MKGRKKVGLYFRDKGERFNKLRLSGGRTSKKINREKSACRKG